MLKNKSSSRFVGAVSSGILISGLLSLSTDFGYGYDCGPHDQPGITCSPGAPNKPAPTPQEEPAPVYENSEPVYETPAPAYTSPAVTASPAPAAPKPPKKKKPKSPKSRPHSVSPLSEVDTPVGVDLFSPDAKPVFSFDPVGRDNVGRPIRNYVTPPLVTGAETDAEFVFVRDHLLAGLPVVGGLVGAGLGLPLGLLGPVGYSLFPGLSLGSLGSLIGGNIGLYTGALVLFATYLLMYGASLAFTSLGALAGSLAVVTASLYGFSVIGGLLGSLIGFGVGSFGNAFASGLTSSLIPASSLGGGVLSAGSGASLGAGVTASAPSVGMGIGAWVGNIHSSALAPAAGSVNYLIHLGLVASLGSASSYTPPLASSLSISPSLATAGATAGLVTGITTGIAGFLSGTQIHVDDNPPTPAPKQSKRK